MTDLTAFSGSFTWGAYARHGMLTGLKPDQCRNGRGPSRLDLGSFEVRLSDNSPGVACRGHAWAR